MCCMARRWWTLPGGTKGGFEGASTSREGVAWLGAFAQDDDPQGLWEAVLPLKLTWGRGRW